MATQLPITNGFYVHPSLPVSNQECQNWYVSNVERGGLADAILVGTPGLKQLTATSGTSLHVNRGSHVKNGIPYFVNGTGLYSLNRSVDANGVETFTTTNLGTISGTGRVSMADNGTQLMILVPGSNGYIYNEDAGTPFQQITDTDFTSLGAQHVVFVDGYFAVTTASKKWAISNLNDGLTWSALDFGTAESNPDNNVAPVVFNNQIYIIGEQTTEGFFNVGGSGFPFQRNNVFLEKGCSAPFSVVNGSNTFFMIGGGRDESPAIWQFTGNSYNKISTDVIDNMLNDYTDTEISNAYGMYYAEAGKYFVCFSLPDKCFVYETMSGTWSTRTSIINEADALWRVASIVSAYGRVLVGDTRSGRIGEMSLNHYDEYGYNIIRLFSTMPFSSGGDPFALPYLELTMESGVGSSSVPDPEIGLSISRDGKNFNYERVRRTGKIGEYNQRIIWRKNGRVSRFTALRFRLSEPIKPVIIKLESE